jgi:hypothetical protein
MMTLRIWDDPEFNYLKDKVAGKDIEALTTFSNTLKVSYQHYFTNQYKGLFGFADVGLLFESRSDSLLLPNGDYKKSMTSLPVTIGAGYGRVTGVKAVAQAMAIGNELGLKLTDDQIIKIADAIDRYLDGTFTKVHKDNAEIEFYGELALITGKPEHTSKINQILNSTVYKIIDRWAGWQVKVGYANVFGDGGTIKVAREDYSLKGSVAASFEYAQPISFDKQFYGSVLYMKSLEDKAKVNPVDVLAIYASFAMEHTYKWASSLTASYESYTFNVGDALSSYEIKARTDYYFINKLSAYGSLSFSKNEALRNGVSIFATGVKDGTIDFKLGFRYWVF